ncbi:MAG: RIP metalloprotease RseP [Candidatus Omnitrophica bacterium]|nr:RIP metalloprotease RseP [Candidatus Omnitrophota bacterium]MBU1924951.1 RIP metalloprotease RseP [Candidatus Omnitrophota bacterium]MBU2063196.1 RIP metalloprotease RseP [Candidatus Omnitrophota bacterium]
MLSTIAFIFVLSFLVIVHELGHFIVAKLYKVRVEIFSLGFGKKLLSFKTGDTEYRLSLIPFGGYIKVTGENPEEKREGAPWEFLSKPVGQRAAIIFAGPAFNYVFAFLLFSCVFYSGMPHLASRIGEVRAGYPAYTAGIKAKDKIISIDGKKIRFWDEVSQIIHEKTEHEEIVVQLEREEKVLSLSVITTSETVKNLFGQEVKIGLIGISPSDEVILVRYSMGESFKLALLQVVKLTKITAIALYKMLTGQMSARESITGPVGIFYITGEAARLGFVYLLQLMGVLSVSLAIINLFPLPVLDGGHLLFLFFEKIKGRPLSFKTQELAARIGLSLIVTLMVFIFYNDFIRFGIFDKIAKIFTNNFTPRP